MFESFTTPFRGNSLVCRSPVSARPAAAAAAAAAAPLLRLSPAGVTQAVAEGAVIVINAMTGRGGQADPAEQQQQQQQQQQATASAEPEHAEAGGDRQQSIEALILALQLESQQVKKLQAGYMSMVALVSTLEVGLTKAERRAAAAENRLASVEGERQLEHDARQQLQRRVDSFEAAVASCHEAVQTASRCDQRLQDIEEARQLQREEQLRLSQQFAALRNEVRGQAAAAAAAAAAASAATPGAVTSEVVQGPADAGPPIASHRASGGAREAAVAGGGHVAATASKPQGAVSLPPHLRGGPSAGAAGSIAGRRGGPNAPRPAAPPPPPPPPPARLKVSGIPEARVGPPGGLPRAVDGILRRLSLKPGSDVTVLRIERLGQFNQHTAGHRPRPVVVEVLDAREAERVVEMQCRIGADVNVIRHFLPWSEYRERRGARPPPADVPQRP